MTAINVILGDSREVLKTMPADHFDSVCTDPPYALTSIVKRFGKPGAAPAKGNEAFMRASTGFMGQQWDNGETAFDPGFWREVLRVMKPGAHLVAFSGTRTYHRMAVAIEDAGFEIRDQIGWAYGSGFPKSHDLAQSIEKTLTTGRARRADRDRGGLPRNRFSGSEEGTLIANTGGKVPLTTAEAIAWEGWGTALKPAWEPICLARKPLSEGTVAANVLRWGTGALNIDGCRVETEETITATRNALAGGIEPGGMGKSGEKVFQTYTQNKAGRWPANIAHDGSDEVVDAFPDSEGSGSARTLNRTGGLRADGYGMNADNSDAAPLRDAGSGSAARFFYTAKADDGDRLGSGHPTVKPVDLMQWLVRLVTPPGGLVLEPFAGTGTTGEAAFREKLRCTMIEREAKFYADILRRIGLLEAGPVERRHATVKAKLESGRIKKEKVAPAPLFKDHE